MPRGVTILAGGGAEATDKTFSLVATVGSETYGICSNRFLDKEFKTVKYELKVTVHGANSFSYDENTQLKVRGQSNIFNHRDKNTLTRVS